MFITTLSLLRAPTERRPEIELTKMEIIRTAIVIFALPLTWHFKPRRHTVSPVFHLILQAPLQGKEKKEKASLCTDEDIWALKGKFLSLRTEAVGFHTPVLAPSISEAC